MYRVTEKKKSDTYHKWNFPRGSSTATAHSKPVGIAQRRWHNAVLLQLVYPVLQLWNDHIPMLDLHLKHLKSILEFHLNLPQMALDHMLYAQQYFAEIFMLFYRT